MAYQCSCGRRCGRGGAYSLLGELYSREAADFKSENRQILNTIDWVTEGTGEKGIWAIDCGANRSILLKELLGKGLRFVVRLVGDRNFILREGEKKNAFKDRLELPLFSPTGDDDSKRLLKKCGF